MKAVMVLCGPGILVGLVMVIDGCLPGRAHFPIGIAVGAIVLGVLLELIVTVAGVEAGLGWGRRQGRRLFGVLPAWMVVVCSAVAGVWVIGSVIVFTTSADPLSIMSGGAAAVLNFSVLPHAYGVWRNANPKPDDDEYWIPPKPPDYGPSWRSR